MSRPLDGALKALRGEEPSASGAGTTVQKTRLQIAQEILESYSFNKKTGVSKFTIPANVTDVEAMKALNEYFTTHFPRFKTEVIPAGTLKWLEKLPSDFPAHCKERDYSQAREITITAVVEGTHLEKRSTQERELKLVSLVFSDPRDQAMAAAIHACKHKGKDLFDRAFVRGSVPGFALQTITNFGIQLLKCRDSDSHTCCLASGSPSPN